MRMFILVLCVAWSSGLAIAQVTNPIECDKACLDREFKYQFCDQWGRQVEKCSKDPNNEYLNGLRPSKQATPLCVNSNFQFQFYELIIDPSQDTMPGKNVVVFDIHDCVFLLNRAAGDWTYWCPPQGPNQEYPRCCINATFGDRNTNWRGLPIGQVRAIMWNPPGDFVGTPGYCRANCSESYLALNSDPEFTHPDENGVPRQFFFTRNLEGLRALRPDLQYSSFYSIVLHELGHWLGLGHANGPDSYGNSCSSSQSIMETGSKGEWNQVDRGMTEDDVCAFRKLYCCAGTVDKLDVDEMAGQSQHYQFDVRPNPLHGDLLTLTLSDRMQGRMVRLRVLNAVGEAVLDRPVRPEEREPAIDAAGWENGIYFVEIIHEKGVAGRKVVVQR